MTIAILLSLFGLITFGMIFLLVAATRSGAEADARAFQKAPVCADATSVGCRSQRPGIVRGYETRYAGKSATGYYMLVATEQQNYAVHVARDLYARRSLAVGQSVDLELWRGHVSAITTTRPSDIIGVATAHPDATFATILTQTPPMNLTVMQTIITEDNPGNLQAVSDNVFPVSLVGVLISAIYPIRVGVRRARRRHVDSGDIDTARP